MNAERAIVFDFDGVIVDSEPVHEDATRRAARAVGLDFPHEKYVEEYIGYDDRDLFRAIARDHGRELSPDDLTELRRAKEAFVQEMLHAGMAPAWPGSVELVRRAKEAGPIAVCSGALRAEIEPVLSRLAIRELFGVIVSADDVSRSKPHPACYELTARKLGIPAAACVAIEDTPTGATAARDAGMRVVGVCHAFKPEAFRGIAHATFASTSVMSVAKLLSV